MNDCGDRPTICTCVWLAPPPFPHLYKALTLCSAAILSLLFVWTRHIVVSVGGFFFSFSFLCLTWSSLLCWYLCFVCLVFFFFAFIKTVWTFLCVWVTAVAVTKSSVQTKHRGFDLLSKTEFYREVFLWWKQKSSDWNPGRGGVYLTDPLKNEREQQWMCFFPFHHF